VVAALALPAPLLATAPTVARAAAVQCSVDYRANDWGSGFTVDVTITNRGTDAIDGWVLTYGYTGNQRLTNGWNGVWSQTGQAVTVTNAAWNARIAPGAAVTPGGQFTYSGTNAAPASFAVNGTTCAGAHQPPVAVLTSPAAGATYTRGDTVQLAATAAAADGATVTSVAFYDDATLLGTDTSAPYTLAVSTLAVGSHSLFAKATDSLGAAGESAPVGVTVVAGPAVVAAPAQLGVRQGASGTFQVSLSTQPAADVTVTTARTAGNAGLSVTGGATLTFTRSNWSTPRAVTVTADAAGTGAATFTASAPATRRHRSSSPSSRRPSSTTPGSSTSTRRSRIPPTATSRPRASRTTRWRRSSSRRRTTATRRRPRPTATALAAVDVRPGDR
jgi:hypothetical protein